MRQGRGLLPDNRPRLFYFCCHSTRNDGLNVLIFHAEVGKFAGVDFFHIHDFFHARGGRAHAAPFNHFIYVFFFSFKQGFNTSVGHIAHPAGKVKRPCGMSCFRAEEYSLHSAGNIDMDSFHVIPLPTNAFHLRHFVPPFDMLRDRLRQWRIGKRNGLQPFSINFICRANVKVRLFRA